jgi:hypothetical protein
MAPDDAIAAATLDVLVRLARDGRPEGDGSGVFGNGAPDAGSPQEAEAAARSILAAVGYAVSEQEVRSPQGRSSGMFSRRLAHVRIDLAARHPDDRAAAVICHEAAHCLDPGPYDFDHPWSVTPQQRRQALVAQLVACLSSHAFVRGVLNIAAGPGQLALAQRMVHALADGAKLDPGTAQDVAGRVATVTGTMRAALAAPPWTRPATREVAVDRGRGVMWLAVGPAAEDPDPPSPPAAVAARLSREAQRRFRDDPRFTADLDRWRPVAMAPDA